MKSLSTSTRLVLLVTVMASLLLIVGMFGLTGIYKTNDSLKTVYADRTVPMWQLSEVQRLMQRSWLIVTLAQNLKSPEFTGKYASEIEDNIASINTLYNQYLQTYLTPEEQIIAERFRIDLKKMQADGLRPAAAALRASNFDELRRIEADVFIPASFEFRSDIQKLTRLQLDVASAEYDMAKTTFDRYRLASITLIASGFVFAILFGGFLVRSIMQSRLEFERSERAKTDLQRQLQQAQKSQALGQLTGGIAHDFNNILASVLGYSNLALDKLVTDKESKLARYLTEIITASERARDLVAKMLVFTRTRPDQNAILVWPHEVIREVESMMVHSVPSGILIQKQLDEVGQILINDGELNQALINLIINARDAIEVQGTIDIHLRQVEFTDKISFITQQQFSGTFIAIEVADSGSGIAPEILPRLFDPFFTTKEVGKGTGLGLSMVQGIMARAEGHILVDSIVGKGSRFMLLFPIPVAKADNMTSPIL